MLSKLYASYRSEVDCFTTPHHRAMNVEISVNVNILNNNGFLW